MRIIQLHKTASPPPYGYRAILVSFDDGTSSTMHVPPTAMGGAAIRDWLERKSGKKVRAWRKAVPKR